MWHLNGRPMPVQEEAYKRLQTRDRYGLWMDMGTGKTAVALNDQTEFMMKHRAPVALVICPNSLKSNWIDVEPKKWGVKFTVTDWKDHPKWGLKNPVCFVMNYEAVLTNGGADFFKFLSSFHVHVTLDESQSIKNHSSKTSKTIREFLKGEWVRRVILLSGTPMTQNPMDLYPQFRALGELEGVNPFAFRARYCKMGGFKGKQVVGIEPFMKDELLDRLARVSWRASKKDWLDIPDKLDPVTIDIKMTPDQTRLYREMMEDFIVTVKEREIPANIVIAQLLKLQQISRGFIYDEEKKSVEITDPMKDPALDELMAVQEQTSKLVVMCHFRPTVDRLIKRFTGEGVKFSVLRGGMEQDEIEEAKKHFNEGPGQVIIGQLSAASKGHTLLGPKGDPCFTLAFFENNYNLENRMQAEDRIHRQGQEKACMYYDFAASPQDRKILAALQSKKFNTEAIVEALRGR